MFQLSHLTSATTKLINFNGSRAPDPITWTHDSLSTFPWWLWCGDKWKSGLPKTNHEMNFLKINVKSPFQHGQTCMKSHLCLCSLGLRIIVWKLPYLQSLISCYMWCSLKAKNKFQLSLVRTIHQLTLKRKAITQSGVIALWPWPWLLTSDPVN